MVEVEQLKEENKSLDEQKNKVSESKQVLQKVKSMTLFSSIRTIINNLNQHLPTCVCGS